MIRSGPVGSHTKNHQRREDTNLFNGLSNWIAILYTNNNPYKRTAVQSSHRRAANFILLHIMICIPFLEVVPPAPTLTITTDALRLTSLSPAAMTPALILQTGTRC